MNLLTAYNTQEECAEVIQAISKCLRFGMERVNPETQVDNKSHLAFELGQLEFMIGKLEADLELDRRVMLNGYNKKAMTYATYAKLFQPEPKDTL